LHFCLIWGEVKNPFPRKKNSSFRFWVFCSTDTQPIEGTQTPTERESRKTNFIRRPYEPTWNKVGRNRPDGRYQPIDGTNVRNVYRTNSVSPIIVRPETGRGKFLRKINNFVIELFIYFIHI
jgi:hypothetical protein